jgi:O-methyltransferase involved in polyketide biosynthesis
VVGPAPEEFFNSTTPSVPRMYDYALGGKDNFAADREAADAIMRAAPEAMQHAVENREFLRRAVQYVGTQGMTQFIDIGCGLPTAENTHQIAQNSNRLARVAYVDNDRLTVAHARALLATDDRTVAIEGDLREPEKILGSPEVGSLIDFSKPLAVVMVAVVHFLDDNVAYQAVRRIRDAIPSGSFLVISHGAVDDSTEDQLEVIRSTYRAAHSPITMRSRGEFERYFEGLELVPPGVVSINSWPNPASAPGRILSYGGVARKP